MASALSLSRLNLFSADPHKNLVIIAPKTRSDAGPVDRVDPDHPLCEKYEREITNEEIADLNRRGILQPLRIVRDGTELCLVVMGRRRTRMARVINTLRAEWNAGKTNWLFPAERADGEKELPAMTVPVMLLQGTDLELRAAKIAENLQRANYSASQVAHELQDYIKAGGTVKEAAEAAGQKEFFVKSHLAYLDLSKELQAAVDSGQVKITAAAQLANLPREEQNKALAESREAGNKMTLTEAKRSVARSRNGNDADVSPKKGEIARMLALLQSGDGELTPTQRTAAVAMLEWVRTGKRPAKDLMKLPKLGAAVKATK